MTLIAGTSMKGAGNTKVGTDGEDALRDMCQRPHRGALVAEFRVSATAKGEPPNSPQTERTPAGDGPAALVWRYICGAAVALRFLAAPNAGGAWLLSP